MNHDSHRDAGVSLIELIVYVLLASIVVLTTAMILINSWNTQKDVTSVSEATNRGQSMGSTIERAMRNALDFEVSPDQQELRVRTSLTGSQQCQAFYLATGTSRLAQSSGLLPSTTTSWTVWNTGVKKNGATPFFVATGQHLVYTFDIETDSAPVRFSGEVSTRSTPTGVSSPCW
ncbi:type IV pilus modification PilV family protein [Microbacterium sulfonylureivorans]|uniref:type IV pilus modification PilV family protein n=1 Tax=Microbacterium sulfonylureivorans TaxID=2486854 RepID=UPI000FDCC6F0|nr:hypothetical protein [Microbacterium sulfonylureivorans]